MYIFAANLTLVIHLIFIIFVVFGALLLFVSLKIAIIHIPAVIWGTYVEFTGSICPLTYLENFFLIKANKASYSNDFIERFLLPIVYPNNLTAELQLYLGFAILFINFIIYGIVIKLSKLNLKN